MTRSLRRAHRLASVTLAVLLPPAFLVALAARAPVPAVAGPLAASLGEPALAIRSDRTPLPARAGAGQSLPVALGRDANGARVVEVDTRGATALPDALVYWSAAEPTTESLPLDSFFLGALPDDAVRAYRLPGAAASAGSLFVFSVAWQRVVFSESLETGARP